MTKQGYIRRQNLGFSLSISCHFWILELVWVQLQSQSRNNTIDACPHIFFKSIKIPFQKKVLWAAQRWTASLVYLLWNYKINFVGVEFLFRSVDDTKANQRGELFLKLTPLDGLSLQNKCDYSSKTVTVLKQKLFK